MVFSLNSLQTKEGYVVFGLGGIAAQTEHHKVAYFLSDLPKRPLKVC